MSNYLTLCQKYINLTGITGGTLTSVTNQTGMNLRIVTWIADADEDIQNTYVDMKVHRTDTEITLVSGTDEYSLDDLSITDFNRWSRDDFFIDPETNAYAPLSWFVYEDWLKSSERLGVKVSGTPSRITAKPDGTLVFMDKPNAAKTVWGTYYKKPTRMTANTSTSDIPTQFEMAIIHRAKMFHAEYYEDDPLYVKAERSFIKVLGELMANQVPGIDLNTTGAVDPQDSFIEVV